MKKVVTFMILLFHEVYFVQCVDISVEEFDMFKKKIVELERKFDACQWQTTNSKRLLLGTTELSNKIAFDAILTKNLDHSGVMDTTVVFDSVITNIGNAYQKDLGAFIAPVSGVYLFSFTIHAEWAANILASLTINGNKVTTIQVDGSGTGQLVASSSRTAILSLNKDDHAYIQIWKESRGMLQSRSSGHSSLAGVLLFDN